MELQQVDGGDIEILWKSYAEKDPFAKSALQIQLDDAVFESAFKVQPRIPDEPKNLRDVIPSGKGRISQEDYLDRVRRGQRLGMKSLLHLINSERSVDWEKPSTVCVIGGGPTLQDEVGALRRLVNRGAKVFAVNKSHDWLLKRGFRCDYAALLDPKEWVADYIDTESLLRKARANAGKHFVQPKYLIASQCHEKVLEKFRLNPHAYMWHAAAGLGESLLLNTEFAGEEWVNIAGASVIGLRAAGICHGLGFRTIHLFGIDGSAKPGNKLYSYDKPHIEPTWRDFEVKLTSGWNRKFTANHHMARAVYEFEDMLREWDAHIKAGTMEPFSIRVHGNPEHSAIGMVAAGMGIHADPTENERYGKPPEARAA